MAKSLPKSAPSRSRQSPPAKSARAAAPPAAKTTVTKLPPRARPLPAKAAPAKAAATRTPAKKAPPAKAANGRARTAVVEKSPATEEEIISAVAGKITSRTTGGMTWLSAKAAKIQTVEISVEAPTPEPAIPVEAVVVEDAAPAAAESVAAGPVIEEPVAAEAAPAAAEGTPPPAEVKQEPPDLTDEEPPVSVVTEAVVDEAATFGTAAPKAPAPPPAASTAPVTQPLLLALGTAMRQLSGALALQGLAFIAFCVLVSGGVPTSGLPQVLAAVIPLFAMLLAVAGYLSFHGTRRLLDQLEHDRLRHDPAHPPAPLAPARLLAHQPALIILGFLIVVWFVIGATVWWL